MKSGKNNVRRNTGIHRKFGLGHFIHVVVKLPSIANKLNVKKQVIDVKRSLGIKKSSEYGFISKK